MANIAGYTRLPEPTREYVRTAARTQAELAAQRYAELLAAEAGIAARSVFADLAQLVFRLTEDINGPSATIVGAYTINGRQLWHEDDHTEWPDESLVTDYLAATADWCEDYFPPTEETGDLFLLDLDT